MAEANHQSHYPYLARELDVSMRSWVDTVAMFATGPGPEAAANRAQISKLLNSSIPRLALEVSERIGPEGLQSDLDWPLRNPSTISLVPWWGKREDAKRGYGPSLTFHIHDGSSTITDLGSFTLAHQGPWGSNSFVLMGSQIHEEPKAVSVGTADAIASEKSAMTRSIQDALASALKSLPTLSADKSLAASVRHAVRDIGSILYAHAYPRVVAAINAKNKSKAVSLTTGHSSTAERTRAAEEYSQPSPQHGPSVLLSIPIELSVGEETVCDKSWLVLEMKSEVEYGRGRQGDKIVWHASEFRPLQQHPDEGRDLQDIQEEGGGKI